MKIDGKTKIIGFLGSTYKTSKMYALYNSAFEKLNLNYAYIPFNARDPKKAVESIRNLEFHAVGVTVPFKETVIAYIDELDRNSKTIGAVNAIVNRNGKLVGYNTDGTGAVKALKEQTSLTNKKILLLGAGGAAKAIAHALIKEKGRLTILNRTPEAVGKLAGKLNCTGELLSELPKYICDTDIVINATTVGMSPGVKESLIEGNMLNNKILVMDLVTNPQETKLIQEAVKKKCKIVSGKRMLLWQAVLKFELFTGIAPPIKTMEEALYA